MDDDDYARVDYSGSILLDPDRERALGKILLAGRQAERKLRGIKTLPVNAKRKLRDQVKRMPAAIDELVNANTRLVQWIASKYTTESHDDLVQEGMEGLMKAVHKWDYRRGRFSTYATWWIRQAISRAVINVDKLVRVPVHAPARRKAVLAKIEAAKQQNGGNLSMRELASAAGVGRSHLEAYLQMYAPVCSLDAPLKPDSDTELGELLAERNTASGDGSPDFMGEVEASEARSKILAMIDELPPRVASVMKDHFGFTTGEGMTLEEIGQNRNLTRERIRQLVITGVGYLQHPARRRRVGELLGVR